MSIDNVANELSRNTGVPPDHVKKILQALDIQKGMDAVGSRAGRNHDGNVTAKDLKVSIRTGRTFLTV